MYLLLLKFLYEGTMSRPRKLEQVSRYQGVVEKETYQYRLRYASLLQVNVVSFSVRITSKFVLGRSSNHKQWCFRETSRLSNWVSSFLNRPQI